MTLQPPLSLSSSAFLDFITYDSLVLWLDATDESTLTKPSDRPSAWNDKSSEGNNAAQETPSDQGTWTENSIGTKPAIVFTDDQHMVVPDAASLNFDSGSGFTIFMVVDFDGYDNQGSSINSLLAKGAATLLSDTYNIQTNSGNAFWFQSGNNELNMNSGGAINGSAHILTARMDNDDTRSDTYIDGGNLTTNASATVGSDNALDLVIAGDSTSARFGAGKYGEIMIYNKLLSNTELLDLLLILSPKWGITLA